MIVYQAAPYVGVGKAFDVRHEVLMELGILLLSTSDKRPRRRWTE
jgi:hypothetical protein